MRRREVHFAQHARARFAERIAEPGTEADQALADLFAAASEDKRWLNDTEFKLYLYRRYGYEKRFRFYMHQTQQLVFVVVEEPHADVVVTVYKGWPMGMRWGG